MGCFWSKQRGFGPGFAIKSTDARCHLVVGFRFKKRLQLSGFFRASNKVPIMLADVPDKTNQETHGSVGRSFNPAAATRQGV